MAISIKTFLIRNNGKTEIRRFILEDETKGKSIDSVWEKINKLYGDNIQERGFVLFWKDDDDDEILMTSDEEFVTALKAIKQDVLKLFIQKPKHGKRSSKQQESSELHQGITCDGCEGSVGGMRYKCLQCYDYDLCSGCEHKNLHPEHLMLRIPSPNFFGSAFHGFPHWLFGGHRGRHGCGWRRMHKFHQSHEKDSSSQHHHNPLFNPGEILERLWSVVGNFVPQAGTRGHAQAPNKNQDTTTPAPPTPNEYLQSVGETVAAMLDPLGIDVTVDVEHEGDRKRCKVPAQDDQPSTKHDKKSEETSSDEKLTTNVVEEEAASNGQSPEASTSNSESSKENSPQNSMPSPAQVYISNLTKALNSLSVANGFSNDPQSHPDNDWTYINYYDKEHDKEHDKQHDKEHDSSASPRQTEVKTVFTPETDDVPDSAANSSHPDPMIALAVNQMTSMGYDNENQWLTGLLEMNDGNVDQTIEQITSLQNDNNKMAEFMISFMQRSGGNLSQLLQTLQSIKKYSNMG